MPERTPRLDRKVALVTGAARGIGAAVAEALVREGARVLLTDVRDTLGLKVASDLGEHAWYLHLDVANEQNWVAVMNSAIAKWGSLDVLVNNAGITGLESGTELHDPEHASLDAWREVHRTNLDGVFLGCKHAIRAMRASRSGAIVNISSRSGIVGIPAAAAYASSKAAVRNHTKTVALYCAAQGLHIRCNSVNPAAILTPMWEPVLGDGPDRQQRMRDAVADTPMRRFGTAAEVAAVVVMLASDDAAYMTGAEVNIDGGLLAGSAAAPSANEPSTKEPTAD